MTAAALENPRAVHPYFKKPTCLPSDRHARATGTGPWGVPELCAAYQWPTNLAGGGVIAIVELGGGYTKADLAAYFASVNQPMPTIVDVSVDGTLNAPGTSDADAEVALDIEVAAASYYVATGKPAVIRMYWAQDIAAAVRKAAADKCDVCSISWGADETDWGKAAASDMEAAAQEAAYAGMMIFAASGDNDSSDGGVGAANVDLPAGCTHVVGCGGTTKTRSSETVWNDTPGSATGDGTGGGYSTLFAMPQWQGDNHAPKGPGRLVPDVAANADPNTGYQVYYGGAHEVVGGTSAVSPLYAGLFAALGRHLAFVGDKLWKNAAAFVDVTSGDNGLYHSQVGPDPCTGLGVPVGKKVEALFTQTPTPAPPPPGPGSGPTPPPAVTPVTIDQAIAWAESKLPNAWMTPAIARTFIAAGLRTHWPKATP